MHSYGQPKCHLISPQRDITGAALPSDELEGDLVLPGMAVLKCCSGV